MKTYEVSILKDGIYHSNLVKTDKTPEGIEAWYAEHKTGVEVVGIILATEDSVKPGKPIITI